MAESQYLSNVTQTNGCRVWQNPLGSSKYPVPDGSKELYIRSIPKDLFEDDLLPHFERFGPIYQFRLLIEFDTGNRGFGYLIYYWDKSALECLDTMPFFFVKPGLLLDVERSEVRSHLSAINIPLSIHDDEIERAFKKLYTEASRIVVKRNGYEQFDGEQKQKSCSAIIEFPNHNSAVMAKRWSGLGSINLWNRNIKVLWSRHEEIIDLVQPSQSFNHLLAHNVPEYLDPEEFGKMMCDYVGSNEIVSIRPMQNDWLIEFTNHEATFTIQAIFNHRVIADHKIFVELLSYQRLQTLASFADFDHELRCLCIANYYDPPIFIYGKVIPMTKTQLVSVIIKNNRKNLFTTFIIEVCYENLTDIHARVCEAVFFFLLDIKNLPKKNVVMKCINNFLYLVGVINRLDDPILTASGLRAHDSFYLYLEDIYGLARMSFELITSENLKEVHREYKMILQEKNVRHQFISGIFSNDHTLGCIDPIYRRGKPMKYLMDSRHMILAMCDLISLSNITQTSLPSIIDIKPLGTYAPSQFAIEKLELIPLSIAQRNNVHFTYRPCIEFIRVDTFGPLKAPKAFEQRLISAQLQEIANHLMQPKLPIELPIPSFASLNFFDYAPGRPIQSKTDTRHCLSDFLMELNLNQKN